MSSNEENKNDQNESQSERPDGPDWPEHGRGRWCGGRRRWLMIPFILGAILIKGAIAMCLWNALIPDLFHGPELQYVQAIGLMILAKLFVGFGPGFRRFGPGGFGHHHHHHGWRHRWMHMTPEEREKMRSEFRRRCGK